MEKRDQMIKRVILIVLIVCVVTAIIIVSVVNSNKNKAPENQGSGSSGNSEEEKYEENKEQTDLKGNENVDVNNGVATNTSNKLKETKTFKGCSVNVASVKTANGSTDMVINIKNNSDSDINLDIVNIEVLDNNGKVFKEIPAYFGQVKAGATKTAAVSTQIDITNMHDIKLK